MNDHRWWMFLSHEWQAAAVYHRMRPVVSNLTLEAVEDVAVAETDVLYRCECGKVKVVTIGGNWKLEEVRS